MSEIQIKRDDPALRIAMVKLVQDLGQLLDEHAAKLTQDDSRFSVDATRELLAWQLIEFVSQAHIDLHDNVVKGHQFTEDHAMAWFEVDQAITMHRELIPVARDRSRKS